MKKILDISQILNDFEGNPIALSDEDSTPVTLKHVLLRYCRLAAQTGLSEAEQTIAYETGMILGTSGGKVSLEQPQYDVLKKLADNGKFRGPGGDLPIFGLEIKVQTKQMVDAAETVKHAKDKEE